MAKPLDKFVVDKLKQFGFGKDAVWDCHGTWVVYHKILEQIAAKEGIVFDQPYVMSAQPDNIAICVTGNLGDKCEWSVGEAAPKNNKNAYPWAMAEKRAKDRVILKLIGLHGFVYSEDEADDFKESKPSGNFTPKWTGPLAKMELKKQLGFLNDALGDCQTAQDLDGIEVDYKAVIEQAEKDLPDWYKGAVEKIAKVRQQCEQMER